MRVRSRESSFLFRRMPESSAADGDRDRNASDLWNGRCPYTRGEMATLMCQEASPWEYADLKQRLSCLKMLLTWQ